MSCDSSKATESKLKFTLQKKNKCSKHNGKLRIFLFKKNLNSEDHRDGDHASSL